jgi:hypothetical protein
MPSGNPATRVDRKSAIKTVWSQFYDRELPCQRFLERTGGLARFENKNILALYIAKNSKVVGLVPGVDVMITIPCDFCQFSAKKISVFLKNQCYDQIFAKTSCTWSKKTPIFLLNFSAKIFKKS